jgi:hypothetical protein
VADWPDFGKPRVRFQYRGASLANLRVPESSARCVSRSGRNLRKGVTGLTCTSGLALTEPFEAFTLSLFLKRDEGTPPLRAKIFDKT